MQTNRNGLHQTLKLEKRMDAQKQFLTLAGKSNGQALVSVIGQVLNQPDLFAFAEFIALPSVQKVSSLCMVKTGSHMFSYNTLCFNYLRNVFLICFGFV